MNPLQGIFSEQFLHALGWMLIHSLWQGALIGILIAIAMIFLQRNTARLRYFIHTTSLAVFAAMALITFIASYYTYQPQQETVAALSQITNMQYAAVAQVPSAAEMTEVTLLETYLERLASYCRGNMPFIVAFWLLGMLAAMLRFLGGYALVRRYRTHRVKPVEGVWRNRFLSLACKVRVSSNVKLLESAIVKVPMAIGYLKPVVLVPLGALNGVPAQQMEAILVHELAHIRRRDYLVNMIQSLLEVIFFYHPVVWWLSGNIRLERENICDDIAITITGNTMEFAKALTNIQEINLAAPGLAAGLSGKNRHRLLHRIRRLTHKPKLHSGFAEGFIAAAILMVSLAGLSAAAMITYPVDEQPAADLDFAPAGLVLPGYASAQEPVLLPDTIKEKQKEQQVMAEREAVKAKEKELSAEQRQRIAEIQAQVEAQREVIEAQVEAMQDHIQDAMEAYREAMEDADIDREAYTKQLMEMMEVYEKELNETQRDFWNNRSQHWNNVYMPYYHLDKDSLMWNFDFPDSLVWFADSFDSYNFNFELPELEELDLNFKTQEELMQLEKELQSLRHVYVPAPAEPWTIHSDADNYLFSPGVGSRAKRLVTDELYEDDLIEHGREYVVVIDERQMLINGEKQTRSIFKKYSRLVESLDESTLFGDGDEFRIFIGR